MVRRLGLGKNNHLTYASLALNPRYDIARQIDISFGAVQSILTSILGKSKVSARWVPRISTKDQKRRRLGISSL